MEPRRTKCKTKKSFRCLTCYENHSTKSAAQKCCSEIETFYTCEDCGEEHEKKSEAEHCCSLWECTFCGEEFERVVEAGKCCEEEISD